MPLSHSDSRHPQSSPSRPAHLPALLDALAAQPTPALIFYGGDAGRIELSGRVLENWVAKTANLLVDDLGLMPGDRVLLDSTVHWRTAVVAAAVWRMGGVVVLDSASWSEAGPGSTPTEPVHLAVVQDTNPESTAPSAADTAPVVMDRWPVDDVMVLAYPGLALAMPEDRRPASAVDFCAEIRAHGDHWSGASTPGPHDDALVVGDRRFTHAMLSEAAIRHTAVLQDQAATGVHLATTSWTAQSLERMIAAWISATAVVLIDREPSEVPEILRAERVTLSWS